VADGMGEGGVGHRVASVMKPTLRCTELQLVTRASGPCG
jgi:hypothetical protein